MVRSYTERMWNTSHDGVSFNVKNGLLSVQMSAYQSHHLLSSLQALIRKITHTDTPELEQQFAKIHRIARIAYFASSVHTLESLDSADCELLTQVKMDDSFHYILSFVAHQASALRTIRYEDILDAHDAIVSIETTMES